MNNQQEKTLLSSDQKRELKKLAHHLKPIIQIGKGGLSEGLMREIDSALLAHELIKMQVSPVLKPSLSEILPKILSETNSSHIDTIGNVVILFRRREKNSQYL